MEKYYKVVGVNIFTKDGSEWLETVFFPNYDSDRFKISDSFNNTWIGVLDTPLNRQFLIDNGYTLEIEIPLI